MAAFHFDAGAQRKGKPLNKDAPPEFCVTMDPWDGCFRQVWCSALFSSTRTRIIAHQKRSLTPFVSTLTPFVSTICFAQVRARVSLAPSASRERTFLPLLRLERFANEVLLLPFNIPQHTIHWLTKGLCQERRHLDSN